MLLYMENLNRIYWGYNVKFWDVRTFCTTLYPRKPSFYFKTPSLTVCQTELDLAVETLMMPLLIILCRYY